MSQHSSARCRRRGKRPSLFIWLYGHRPSHGFDVGPLTTALTAFFAARDSHLRWRLLFLLAEHKTSMSVLLIVGPKCTLTASHAAPWWVTVCLPTGKTDIRTNARRLHYAFRYTRPVNVKNENIQVAVKQTKMRNHSKTANPHPLRNLRSLKVALTARNCRTYDTQLLA